jgi:hypothetical protein
MMRYQTIQNLVDDRYRIGKTSQVVRELQADESRYASTDDGKTALVHAAADL